MQAVELLYSVAPEFDAAAIAERICVLSGGETDAVPGAAVTMFMHKAFVVQYTDAALPAQTVILAAQTAPSVIHYEKALQQTRNFDDAAAAIRSARYVFLVTEMMANGLHPPLRVEVFHAALQAIVELCPPVALAFVYTQQIIDPAAYLAPDDASPVLRAGRMNVRFFDTGDGDFLMDTLGLDAIGLHDLQCHFRGLDPEVVARLLFNVGNYIFENGPVFENGHTVQGPDPESKWVCQFESALVEPARDVLDIRPDAPFAAGDR